jgi:hypothetical protein
MQPINLFTGFDASVVAYAAALRDTRPTRLENRLDHVQLLPSPRGPIAVMFYPHRVEIAVAPTRADTVARTIAGARVRRGRPGGQTWHVLVDSGDITNGSMPALLEAGQEAIDWRAGGKQSSPAPTESSRSAPSPSMPRCSRHGYELQANGGCPGCDDER